MDELRQDDLLEPTYNSSVLIQDVKAKDGREGWQGRVRNIRAMARLDDDDHDIRSKRQWIDENESLKLIQKFQIHGFKFILCVWWDNGGIIFLTF